MKAITTILTLTTLMPFVVSAHPGHAGHETGAFGLPIETLEWLVIAVTVTMVLRISGLRAARRQVIESKRPDSRK